MGGRRSETWTELNTEGLSSTQNRVSNCYTGRFFVNLNCCLVRIDPDDLCYCNVKLRGRPTTGQVNTSNQFVMTDANEFVHGRTRHILSDDNRARDAINLTEAGLAVLVANFREVFICVR